LLAFRRSSLDGRRHVLVITNVGCRPAALPTSLLSADEVACELISGQPPEADGERIVLAPFQTGWFALR
jgi:hypothetical protein